MGSTLTLMLVMLMFVVYTVVGGIFALVWAVRSVTCLIVQIGKQVTNKLLPGWL